MPVPAGFGQVHQAQGLAWGDAGQGEQDAIYFQNGGLVVDTHTGLFDKGGQVFNVAAYGVVPSGGGDQASSIQSVINTVGANPYGGIVYFPRGLYYINSGLTLSNPNVKLVGAGAEATQILVGSGAVASMITCTATRLTIRDMTLNGNTFATNLVRVGANASVNEILRCRLVNSTSSCVNYTATDGSNGFTRIESCSLEPLNNAPGVQYDSSAPSTGNNRWLLNTFCPGGILCDVAQVNELIISGCMSSQITFSSNSATKVQCIGNRIAGTPGVGLTLMGNYSQFINNMISYSPITIANGATHWSVIGNRGAHIVDSNTTAGTNTWIDNLEDASQAHMLPGAMTISTTLQVGTNPAQSGSVRIPNGTANGLYARTAANNNDLAVVAIDNNNNIILGQHALSGTSTVIDTPTGGFTGFNVNGVEFARVTSGGAFSPIAQLYPGAENASAEQTSGGILHSTGVPANTNGNNNDWCISDNGHLYFKSAGTWAQKI